MLDDAYYDDKQEIHRNKLQNCSSSITSIGNNHSSHSDQQFLKEHRSSNEPYENTDTFVNINNPYYYYYSKNINPVNNKTNIIMQDGNNKGISKNMEGYVNLRRKYSQRYIMMNTWLPNTWIKLAEYTQKNNHYIMMRRSVAIQRIYCNNGCDIDITSIDNFFNMNKYFNNQSHSYSSNMQLRPRFSKKYNKQRLFKPTELSIIFEDLAY